VQAECPTNYRNVLDGIGLDLVLAAAKQEASVGLRGLPCSGSFAFTLSLGLLLHKNSGRSKALNASVLAF